MHELAPLIRDLAVILGVASIITLLFQKIRQPVVLGYLVAGMIIGPYTPPRALVSDIPNIQTLSELGVIFLMFSLGLEFSFHKLKRVGFSASTTGVIEVVFMLMVGFLTGHLIGWSFNDSLFLGAALAISSTTIIIKALEELNLKSKRFAEVVFGILVVEDLLAILLLVGLSTVVFVGTIFSLSILTAAVKLVIVVGGWFLIGYFLVPLLFRKIIHFVSQETLTLVSVALCLLLVCAAAYFHYSIALGSFIMGSILAETPLVHRIQELIQPVRDIFAAVFFVAVGMLIDPYIIFAKFPLILLLCAVTILGKLFITGLGAFLTGQSINNSLRVGFSMAQIGEFSFIIAVLGITLKATSPDLYPIIVAVSAITTFTTPYLIRLSGYFSKQFDTRMPRRIKGFFESYTLWIYRTLSTKKQTVTHWDIALRLLINGIIVAIIFNFIDEQVSDKVFNIVHQHQTAETITWLTALVASSPFIWGMLIASRNRGHAAPRTSPFLYLIVLVVFIEVACLSITYFDSWIVPTILGFIAIIYFGFSYKRIEKSYEWFESKLIHNLHNHNAHHNRYEELAPWDTHLIEVEVSRESQLANSTLKELDLRQKFGINVVAIYRGDTAILSPRGNKMIMPFDELIILGTDDQIEQFMHYFINAKPEYEPKDLLKNFALKSVQLDKRSAFIGQSIRHSGIREKVKGLVVGLERAGEHVLNPDSTTILKEGDILFLVGENKRLAKLS